MPEGQLIFSETQTQGIASLEGLQECMEEGVVLEATALLCDAQHNLLVSLGPWTGMIPEWTVPEG